MKGAQLGRTIIVVAKIFRRGPIALGVCWLCLSLGLVQIVLVRSLKTSTQTQLAHGSLDGGSILMRKGMSDELASTLDPDEVEALRSLCNEPGCIFSPQVVMQITGAHTGSAETSLVFRGVENFFKIPGVTVSLTLGRLPRPGLDEVMAGVYVLTDNRLSVGDSVGVKGHRFRIVGAFKAQGAPLDTELLGYADQLRSVNGGGWSTVWTQNRAGSQSAIGDRDIKERLQDAVSVIPLREHWDNEFQDARSLLSRIVMFVTVLVVVFTLLAYASNLAGVIRRSWRDLFILQLLGFDLRSIAAGLAIVGAGIGIAAGLTGCLAAVLLSPLMQIAVPVGMQTLAVPMAVSGGDAGIALILSGTLGAVGAFLAGLPMYRRSLGTARGRLNTVRVKES